MTAGFRDQLRFGSLKLRIAVLYAGLFAVVLTAILIIAGNGLSRFGEANAANDLRANARVFDEMLERRAQQMRSSADVLSRDFGFREAIATHESATIDSALASLKSRSNSAAAFVVAYDGSLLASGGATVPDPEKLWYALDDGQQHGIIEVNGMLAMAAASPIEAPDVIGWLVLAQPLDKHEMIRLARLAAFDLEARVANRSTLPAWMRGEPSGQVMERITDERWLYQVTDIAALQTGIEPQLVLRHSLTRSLAQYFYLKVLLVALALVGIGLVFALSWRVARTVTGPLQRLDEATRAIGEGRSVELPVQSDDEIGRLATSFTAMVSAIEEREREIVHVGLHDELTGLPNRKLFIEQLEQAVFRCPTGEKLMVVYADLDDFKVVNDTLGHPAGDSMLRDVARQLRSDLPNALVARLGGDEFAVLFQHLDEQENLAALAERVSDSFQRSIRIDGQQADCSASLGVAIAPGDGNDGTTLMKHADLALYRAKSEGKATYHFFEPELDEQARRRRQMELDMRLALKEGGFRLHYQPLYSAVGESLQGFEALIRWPQADGRIVSPADFIPLAEETGLIIPIGEWVVHEACNQAMAWPGNVSVAINVSPKQFSTPGLAGVILQALASSGLPPHRLELEITESIFIANVDQTLATLHGLRELGVRIALDDFGTGYSSLSYLRSFPFDKVKIDRSFVQDLVLGGNGHAVIRAITTLADALGMETLAEGVEEQEQLEILRREGCRYIQGFLFSKPMAAEDIDAKFGWNAQPLNRLSA